MESPVPEPVGAAKRSKPKPATRIWPVVSMLVMATGIAALATWHALNSLAETNAMTDQRAAARSGRIQLIQANSLFKDMETGMRGFALTGDAQFLKPYHDARENIPEAYGKTKVLLAEKLPPGFTWSEFDRLLQLRQDLAAQVIGARIRQGDAVIDDVSLFEPGRQAMDGIRAIIQQLDTHLLQFIERQDQAVRAARLRA